jgi:uncharacterized protein YdeI (BOF family)
MKKLVLAGLVALSLVGTNSVVQAHDENPNNVKDHVSSIRWIQERDKDDDIGVDQRYVVLVGKVTKVIKDNVYLFSDGTGTIQLDSDVKLPVGESIVVRGEIDQAFLGIGDLEVDVQSFRHNK